MCLTHVHDKTLLVTEGWKCFRQLEDGSLVPLFYHPDFVFKIGEWNEDNIASASTIPYNYGEVRYRAGFHYSPDREALEDYYSSSSQPGWVVRKVRADNIVASGVQEGSGRVYGELPSVKPRQLVVLVVCVATRIFIEPE